MGSITCTRYMENTYKVEGLKNFFVLEMSQFSEFYSLHSCIMHSLYFLWLSILSSSLCRKQSFGEIFLVIFISNVPLHFWKRFALANSSQSNSYHKKKHLRSDIPARVSSFIKFLFPGMRVESRARKLQLTQPGCQENKIRRSCLRSICPSN